MPEADFAEAQHYAARHLLPMRRIELMLARLTAEVATGRGLKDVTPDDFMIRIREADEDAPPVTTEQARQAIGFKPTAKRRKAIS
jgi:hypothetical protein